MRININTKSKILEYLKEGPITREEIVLKMLENTSHNPSFMGFMVMINTAGNYLNCLIKDDIVALPNKDTDYKYVLAK